MGVGGRETWGTRLHFWKLAVAAFAALFVFCGSQSAGSAGIGCTRQLFAIAVP